MVPKVTNTKTDGNLAVARVTERILAIIAPCEKGTQNAPQAFTSAADALATFGYGELTEAAAHVIDAAKVPVVCVRSTTAVAASKSTVTKTGTGTSVITATGNALDAYSIKLLVVAGGTIGTAGISVQYSLDGGATYSAVTALGTANSLAIPNSGITLAFAAGTLVAGDAATLTTVGAKMNASDLQSALDALKSYSGEWLRCLVLGIDADASVLAQLDTAARSYQGDNLYPEFIAPLRARTLSPIEETRSAYQTALAAVVGAVASLETCAVADVFETVSPLTGRRIVRPAALTVAARLVATPHDGVDASDLSLGALPNAFLSSADGATKYHDERLYPGLEILKITALRSFAGRPRRAGAYVNIAHVLSPPQSDYKCFAYSAIHNRVIESAASMLETRLNKGLLLKEGGSVRDDVAKAIEDAITEELRTLYVETGMVSSARIELSRTDNVLTTGVVSYWVPVFPLGYVREFRGKSGLVRAVKGA